MVQTKRQTDGKRQIQADRHRDKETDKQRTGRDRETRGEIKNSETDRGRIRQTERQTEGETHRDRTQRQIR